MYQIIMFVHVFAAACIIALVLVQQGKGATMGAAFGSGASQTVFGSRGSGSFLFRVTLGLALVFFITSIALNRIATDAYKQVKVITYPSVPAKTAPVSPVNNIPAPPAASVPASSSAPQPADIPVKNN